MVKKKQKTLRRVLYEDVTAIQLMHIAQTAESFGYKFKFKHLSTYPSPVILDELFNLDDEQLTEIYNTWLMREGRNVPRDIEIVSRKLSGTN
jgi:hypothetical protein